MKRISPLITRAGVAVLTVFIMFQLQSCSQHKGIMQCPEVGYNAHHEKFNMHAFHISKRHMHNNEKTATAAVHTANADRSPMMFDTLTPKAPIGYATSNNEVPQLKTGMEMFKNLSEEQRDQVKDQVSTMFSKNKIIKGAILKKFDKMDKKYPAPPPAQAYEGGGRLSTGEILSIVAIACAVTWVLGILGLILGAIALVKINREGGATWARVLAIVAIVIGALAFLSFFGYVFFVII